jgi:hypothetical protein
MAWRWGLPMAPCNATDSGSDGGFSLTGLAAYANPDFSRSATRRGNIPFATPGTAAQISDLKIHVPEGHLHHLKAHGCGCEDFRSALRASIGRLDTCLVGISRPSRKAAPEYLPANVGPELLQKIDGYGKADLRCPISQSVGSHVESTGYPRGRDRGRNVNAGQIRKVQCSAPLVVVRYKAVGDRV